MSPIGAVLLLLLPCQLQYVRGFSADLRSQESNIIPIVERGNISTLYHIIVNSSVEYLFEFSDPMTVTDARPARVAVTSFSATCKYPVLVVLRQARGVLSWQLPLMVPTQGTKDRVEYHRTSRTLCPNHNYRHPFETIPFSQASVQADLETPGVEHDVYISISSASTQNVNVSLIVEIEEEFIVHLNESRKFYASPSEPRYYQFQWPEEPVTSVLLRVDSDDEICMTVSIQNITCPVFDLERTVQFEGYRQTVNKRGGIALTRSSFPSGFYVVFVVKGDDFDCTGKVSNVTERRKQISFSFTSSIGEEEYLIASVATLFLFLSIYVVALLASLIHYLRKSDTPDFLTNDTQASTSEIEESITSVSRRSCASYVTGDCDDSSLDETDIDTLADIDSDKNVIRSKRELYVCDLARKNTKILRKKSLLYFWNLLTVATFYALPVVQLVISEQMLLNTGNQDLCYYNFLCSHPLGFLSDFNHVFSNVGYVALGLLFLLLVHRRDRMHCQAAAALDCLDKHYGIPQHYGLFYAMGAALVMEGVLSGCYHVCPNHSNFQFDTSFMYVISMLCMLKIYHTRHPDINASAYATFGALALVILVGMCGILAGTPHFWTFFTVFHLTTCLWLSGQVYYMGRLRFGFGMFKGAWRLFRNEFIPHPFIFLKPKYPSRMVLLILGNICNWALAGVVWAYHLDSSFGSYLLAIFMANLLLYTLFYIFMKLCNKERILLQPSMYIILACVFWAASLYFFFRKSISWALTPAQSREFNQPCALLDFYDRHDIWHFLSAFSMFFSFMVLLTLDDDLVHVPRTKIPVF